MKKNKNGQKSKIMWLALPRTGTGALCRPPPPTGLAPNVGSWGAVGGGLLKPDELGEGHLHLPSSVA